MFYLCLAGNKLLIKRCRSDFLRSIYELRSGRLSGGPKSLKSR